MEERTKSGALPRGFAAMDEATQRAISRRGGEGVPREKRSFSRDRALAREAGRKGGRARPKSLAHPDQAHQEGLPSPNAGASGFDQNNDKPH